MPWFQREIRLQPHPRGFHLITREIEKALPELRQVQVGLLHIFIKHTSASLTLNENADPSVREDFERHMNQMVPERALITPIPWRGRMTCRRTSRPP